MKNMKKYISFFIAVFLLLIIVIGCSEIITIDRRSQPGQNDQITLTIRINGNIGSGNAIFFAGNFVESNWKKAIKGTWISGDVLTCEVTPSSNQLAWKPIILPNYGSPYSYNSDEVIEWYPGSDIKTPDGGVWSITVVTTTTIRSVTTTTTIRSGTTTTISVGTTTTTIGGGITTTTIPVWTTTTIGGGTTTTIPAGTTTTTIGGGTTTTIGVGPSKITLTIRVNVGDGNGIFFAGNFVESNLWTKAIRGTCSISGDVWTCEVTPSSDTLAWKPIIILQYSIGASVSLPFSGAIWYKDGWINSDITTPDGGTWDYSSTPSTTIPTGTGTLSILNRTGGKLTYTLNNGAFYTIASGGGRTHTSLPRGYYNIGFYYEYSDGDYEGGGSIDVNLGNILQVTIYSIYDYNIYP